MILITAPYKSNSGYGFKSREILRALHQSKFKEDIYIAQTQWGNNPEVTISRYENEYLLDFKTFGGDDTKNLYPNLHIHVGIPEDFKPFGEKKILFTSGVEVDRISSQWVEFFNKFPDVHIVTPTQFVKRVMTMTNYKDSFGKEFSVQNDFSVIPESYDENMFRDVGYSIYISKIKTEIDDIIGSSPFFFTSGQVIPEQLGHSSDRKNVSTLIRAFFSVFKGEDVNLIGKLNSVDNSHFTKYQFIQNIDKMKYMESKTRQDYENKKDKVRLIFGHLPSEMLFYIYNHPLNLANVFPTRGEGFGRMILEASYSSTPLLTTNIGGHMDFLTDERYTPLQGSYTTIPNESIVGNILVKGSRWYNVSKETISGKLKEEYKYFQKNGEKRKINLPEYQEDGYIRKNFNFDSVKEKINTLVEQKYTVKTIKLNE